MSALADFFLTRFRGVLGYVHMTDYTPMTTGKHMPMRSRMSMYMMASFALPVRDVTEL